MIGVFQVFAVAVTTKHISCDKSVFRGVLTGHMGVNCTGLAGFETSGHPCRILFT